MADQPVQNIANHTKWDPLWHFFLFPLAFFNVLYGVWGVYLNPGLHSFWALVMGCVLLVAIFLIRVYSLKVQDRVIRLEERLRMRELLPPALYQEALRLSEKQLVALRFASDAELPELAEQSLKSNLAPKEIKQRVKSWRADYLRV